MRLLMCMVLSGCTIPAAAMRAPDWDSGGTSSPGDVSHTGSRTVPTMGTGTETGTRSSGIATADTGCVSTTIVFYDGVDQDCDGYDECDGDDDGYDSWEGACTWGTDCDDARDDIYPGAVEDVGSCVDENCDGAVGANCNPPPTCPAGQITNFSATWTASEPATGVIPSCERYASAMNGGTSLQSMTAIASGVDGWTVTNPAANQVTWSNAVLCFSPDDVWYCSVSFIDGAGAVAYGVHTWDANGDGDTTDWYSDYRLRGTLMTTSDAGAGVEMPAQNGKTPLDSLGLLPLNLRGYEYEITF